MNINQNYKIVDVGELIKYANNSRTHSKEQIEQIKNSILEFGFTNPLLIDEKGLIIAGHGRLEAAKELGFKELPCVELVGLTEPQKKALVIADNQLALNAGWDLDVLKAEIEELTAIDFNIDLLGFDNDFLLENIFGNREKIKSGDVPDVDKADDVVTRIGDVWIMGRHKLKCCDSTDIDDIKSLVANSNIDMIFTDPMYNDDISKTLAQFDAINSDHLVLMCTMKQAAGAINCGMYSFRFDLVLYFKTPSSSMNKKVPYYNHKNIIYMTKGAETIFHCDNAKGLFSESGAGYYPSVIEAKKNTNEKHGLTKPVEQIAKIMAGFSANIVCDPYVGSGSTLFACEKLGRSCIAAEIMPEYVDLVVLRWQEMTGKSAILESTGKTYDEVKIERLHNA